MTPLFYVWDRRHGDGVIILGRVPTTFECVHCLRLLYVGRAKLIRCVMKPEYEKLIRQARETGGRYSLTCGGRQAHRDLRRFVMRS